jgi:hypothetical protein
MRGKTMQFIRKSMLSGVTRSRDIDVTEEEYDRWRSGMLIQRAMPHLSDVDREFIMTGITEEEWGEEEWNAEMKEEV